jgi:hypothetical protein
MHQMRRRFYRPVHEDYIAATLQQVLCLIVCAIGR